MERGFISRAGRAPGDQARVLVRAERPAVRRGRRARADSGLRGRRARRRRYVRAPPSGRGALVRRLVLRGTQGLPPARRRRRALPPRPQCGAPPKLRRRSRAPAPPVELFLRACDEVTRSCLDEVPASGQGSLYLRPDPLRHRAHPRRRRREVRAVPRIRIARAATTSPVTPTVSAAVSSCESRRAPASRRELSATRSARRITLRLSRPAAPCTKPATTRPCISTVSATRTSKSRRARTPSSFSRTAAS